MDPRSSEIPFVAHTPKQSIQLKEHLAILLTCYHLTFATITTQILALTTSLLDRRHVVRMSLGLYMRAIVPIGVLYSLSLVCSNLPYLYLSVAFIQMLKVRGQSSLVARHS